jgi:hypothetical protein
MRSRRGGRKPPKGRLRLSRKGIGIRDAGGIGVQEEAGVSCIAVAESLSDGGDVDATAKARAQGWGRRRAHGGRDQKSREKLQRVAVVEEAAEVLEWVYSLAGG